MMLVLCTTPGVLPKSRRLMNENPQSGRPESNAPKGGWGFLAGMPWERITMWVALGLLLYVMRDFFFVIFMTFLLCYFVRRVVNLTLAWFPPGRRTHWVDRGITVTVFTIPPGVFGCQTTS